MAPHQIPCQAFAYFKLTQFSKPLGHFVLVVLMLRLIQRQLSLGKRLQQQHQPVM